MLHTPNVTIVIPTYNRDVYLERAIRSALGTLSLYKSSEIIVVDDGSTDSTPSILSKFKGLITTIRHSTNLGLPSALNTAIKKSSSKYIIRLDSDDYVRPEYVFILESFLRYNNYLDAVRCDYYIVDDRQNKISHVDSSSNPIGCGIMFRREHLISIGLYDPTCLLHEEVDLEKRFLQKYSIEHLPIPLYMYHHHGDNMSLS